MTTPTLKLTVSAEQAQTILNALAAMPFREVSDLIAQIMREAQEQLNPAEQSPTEAD